MICVHPALYARFEIGRITKIGEKSCLIPRRLRTRDAPGSTDFVRYSVSLAGLRAANKTISGALRRS